MERERERERETQREIPGRHAERGLARGEDGETVK